MMERSLQQCLPIYIQSFNDASSGPLVITENMNNWLQEIIDSGDMVVSFIAVHPIIIPV
jgi:hypothetical protein